MEITGTIKVIEATKQVSDKFKSRQFVVTTADTYPQHISLQCTQDKCDMLNSFSVGQVVTASINLRGREWQSPQGETKYFNTIECWKLSKGFAEYDAPPKPKEVDDDLPF